MPHTEVNACANQLALQSKFLSRTLMVFGMFACSGGTCLADIIGRVPSKPVPFSTPVERCIIPASDHHQVNYHLLRAILVVESGLKPATVSKNKNNTADIGIAGINSVHLPELSRFGIGSAELLDECVSSYVAAWKLKKAIAKYGNTWKGIASYHSITPKHNDRYQILLQNELIRSGQLHGQLKPVPRIGRTSIGSLISLDPISSRPDPAHSQSNLIYDEGLVN